MNFFLLIVRVLLGVIFLTFGLNGFLDFIPVPPLTDKANNFFLALTNTGYMLPLWKGVEVITGFLLLFNRFVSLALIMITPVLVNIICYHLFLDQGGLVIALPLLVFHIILLVDRRKSLKPILDIK